MDNSQGVNEIKQYIDGRFAQLEALINSKLNLLDTNTDTVESNTDTVESKLDNIDNKIENLRRELSSGLSRLR